jgi:hypothetical protein
VYVSRLFAVALVSAALVAVAVAPASAAEVTPASSSMADTPPLPPVNPSGPKGTNPRQFMINTLGKLLGPVTPNKWKREQIAYNQRYNFDWETLEQQFGQDPANPNYVGQPDSYGDYVLKNLEQKKKGGSAGTPFTAPATKLTKVAKAASGVFNGIAVISAAETGFSVGKVASRAMGMNADGGLCDPGFNDAGLIALVTATDCSKMNAVTPEYLQALANNPAVTGGNLCIPDGSWCMQLVAVVPQNWTDGNPLFPGYCFIQSGVELGNDQHWRFEIQYTKLGVSRWAAASQGGVAPPGTYGSNNPQNVVYGCYQKGVPRYVNGSGGLGVTGSPINGQVGETNDPITYHFINPFNNTSTDPVSGADSSTSPSTVQCSITGDDGQTYTASSPSFVLKDGKTPAPNCPTLPSGVMPTHIATAVNGAGGKTPIASQDTTAEYQDWFQSYPECRDGQCKLDLLQGQGSTATKSCFDQGSTCNGWFADPDKGTKYQCRYGTHDVAQDQCALYSGVFDPARLKAGAPYSDPMTGEWSGGNSAPTPDTQALGQGIQNPDTQRSCNGLSAPTFDPVAWVMRPIQCALEWAFVPRGAVMSYQFATMQLAWSSTGPGKYADAMLGWKIAPDPQGCSTSMNFPVPLINKTITVPVIQACPGTPMGDYAWFIRGIVSVTLIVAAGFACKRIISSWPS